MTKLTNDEIIKIKADLYGRWHNVLMRKVDYSDFMNYDQAAFWPVYDNGVVVDIICSEDGSADKYYFCESCDEYYVDECMKHCVNEDDDDHLYTQKYIEEPCPPRYK